MPKAKPKVLHTATCSVTGAELVVDETARGLRVLSLSGHTQSEVQVRGEGELSMAQPLELVQVMSLVSLAWLSGGTAADPESPNVLLIGIGGGSIARVLYATMPGRGRVHSIDLEPEVVEAAIQFFGLPATERCTSAAGDGAAYMREHRAKVAAGAAGFDVLLLDAFTSEGLCSSTQRQSTLDDAAACLSPRGLLVVNLHTGRKNDPDDDDYYVARRVLRALCSRFSAVYSIHCMSTQNLIALCHHGDFLDAGAWDARLSAQLERPDVRAACATFSLPATMDRFDFVGGIEQPMKDERGVGTLPE